MECGVDRRPFDRTEMGLSIVGAPVDEPERAGNRAHRHRRQPAIGAPGDIAERPRGVEKAALARICVCEANAAVRRVGGHALAIGIASSRHGAGTDVIGLVADHGSGRCDDRRQGFEGLHY